ncbi:uncharacterized protein LOC132391399 isoform X1 [Hypanus sabinus]|uniref:uncharacterized protein LOC132391399 isoform X1 n=2 Tax=Hypanus sabinus TaxID=79690 RepID=UPI0028C3BD4A|nr:uncharacterized protein LOC132391399 isoform X1 [Hypanus sabinus]
MSAQSSIKSTPPSDKGSKPTSSKPTQALSGVPSAAMSARSGIKSMAPSDKGSRTTSSKSAQARAKAEAAKVRLHYAKQEAVLKMKLATREAEIQKERAAREAERVARQREEAAREAEIQKEKAAREAETQLEMTKISTELHVLQLEGEGEAARVEAEYIEEAEGSRDLTETSSALERTRLERTSDYVQYQADRQARLPSPYLFDNFPSYEEENLPSRPRDEVKNERADNRYTLTPKLQSSMRRDAEVESRMANSMRNVRSQSYGRQRTSPARMPLAADPTLQYLARRDLVTSGLYQFDDKPENYRAWLSTFTNVIDGVQLSATQRLDLMAKWLGKESRDQVRRMRSVYINKPELALSEAWERLWERYGSPDIIERALYRRLENFPKVSAKDHFKLREFGDLLMEIQGAKEDGYSAGLVFLDTPSGIRPIVDKLPFGLQDKWLTVASEYKEDHDGRFPPFELLTRFVCKEAKRRNDPSLVGPGSSSIYTKPGRSVSNVFNIDKPVSVLKTEALTTNNDPGKYCPLHNKPHPLKACRMFREKPLEERTALLKEKRICFRCCSSTSHLARECTIAVKCPECGSPDHVEAMHPDLSPQTESAPSPPQQDGGEGEAHSRSIAVSTNCTEVCGQAQSSRSCSKICLTKVYPKGAKDKAIKAYVILDDQSNRSLVSPEFFKLFNIESERFPYYLKTCSGNMKTQGRKAEGIQIESLDGKVVICLPPLLECNEIMNNRAGIPTPSAVLHQPHLHHIAKHIPELDPKAEILLLLGRDVIQVHKVRQQINGPLNAPFAQRLDLGWVVIGEVCLGDVHKPMVNTLKTNVLESGRHSIFRPCPSVPCIKEAQQGVNKREASDESLGQSVFALTKYDNKLAQSAQDTISLKTKDTKVFRDEANNGVAPLPIREPRQRSPDNKEQAVKRFTSLRKTWKRKPEIQQRTRLAHEVLCTLMAEVTAIINAQSFLPVSSDPENPFILSPSTLLTQKAGAPPPPGDFSDKDLYTKQWRQVQALANQFWSRWRQKYLPLLQQRQKWTEPRRNLQVGDLVLLRDKQVARNSWPTARITATFPSEDGHVRKIELKTTDQGDVKIYQGPVTEVILLLPND